VSVDLLKSAALGASNSSRELPLAHRVNDIAFMNIFLFIFNDDVARAVAVVVDLECVVSRVRRAAIR